MLGQMGCVYRQVSMDDLNQGMVDYVPSAKEQMLGFPKPDYIDLFADKKAQRLNDIVIVNVIEQTASSYQAGTTTSRETQLEGSGNTVPGDVEHSIDLHASHDYEGSGTTQRGGSFVTQIVCVVKDVYPNGNLFIEGNRRVWLNNEDQTLLLRGIVNPDDIEYNNQISSTYVANLAISYEGKGLIGNKQRPGFLAGVLDRAWPF